jgi:hypothetical protein
MGAQEEMVEELLKKLRENWPEDEKDMVQVLNLPIGTMDCVARAVYRWMNERGPIY